MRAVVLLPTMLVLGGCLQALAQEGQEPEWLDDAAWTRDLCDPSEHPAISNDAPREEAFRGPVRRVVDAWTRALGESPMPTTPSETAPGEYSPPPADSGHWEWGTDRGQFRYEFGPDPENQRLTYESKKHWQGQGPRQVVEDALRRLALEPAAFEISESRGLDDSSEFVFIKVLHRVGNHTLGPAVVDAYFALNPSEDDRLGVRIELAPAHDLFAAKLALSEFDAIDNATKFFDCKGSGGEDRYHRFSGIRITHESIAYVIDRDDGEGLGCRAVWSVLIDARTGAAHSYGMTGSLCVD
jgi:hypothetical protein